MLSKMKNLVKEEQGQGMTEYGLLLAVVVGVVVVAMGLFRNQLYNLFISVGDAIARAVEAAR
ncbi:Flp family type IVb pilin [Clostridium sp. JN-9]|uniref:Flp family type IVb pilin n=1 Tax=Clostridium sp. JN-9 TaxID=2507159 RepID=UPI00196B76DD|nr:Flp family type IVb pilin [Clostridium sp. JN-9]